MGLHSLPLECVSDGVFQYRVVGIPAIQYVRLHPLGHKYIADGQLNKVYVENVLRTRCQFSIGILVFQKIRWYLIRVLWDNHGKSHWGILAKIFHSTMSLFIF